MMKKHFTLFLLVLSVFLAGCVSQPKGSGSASNGVIIQSFSTDLAETEPDTPVIFTLLVKNVGGKEAKKVQTELFGLTGDWKADSGSKGRNELVDITNLLPSDPERGITEGQEDLKTWTLISPAKNVKLSYDANVRVYYSYETVSDSLVRAVTYDYFRQTQEKGGIQSSKTTGGPLTINVKVPSTIISNRQVPVQFEIQNVGSGRAYNAYDSSDKPKTDTLDVVKIKVDGADCGGTSIVRLVGGKTGRIYCKINTGDVTNYQDVDISVTLTYRYYVESTTSVSVLPAVEGVTTGGGGTPSVGVSECKSEHGDKPLEAEICGGDNYDKCDGNQLTEYTCGSDNKCTKLYTKACTTICKQLGQQDTGAQCKTKTVTTSLGSKSDVGYCVCGNMANVNFQIQDAGTRTKLSSTITVDDESRTISTDGVDIQLSADDNHWINSVPASLPVDSKPYPLCQIVCKKGTTTIPNTPTPNTPVQLKLSGYSGETVTCIIYYRESLTITCPPTS